MKKIRALIVSTLMMAGLLVVPLTVATVDVSAACTATSSAKDCIKAGSDVKTGGGNADLGEQIKAVVNVLLFILGAIAVIMIVVGGIRYTLSNGDSSAITGAKNTILYAVIGLIVAMLAYAIVNFVVGAF
jgi:hypothetical protein